MTIASITCPYVLMMISHLMSYAITRSLVLTLVAGPVLPQPVVTQVMIDGCGSMILLNNVL